MIFLIFAHRLFLDKLHYREDQRSEAIEATTYLAKIPALPPSLVISLTLTV